jgi:uncharacterized protein (TIGR00299 family) protein
MKTAYFDCISGASGDMILGALLDLGVSIEELRQDLSALNLTGYDIKSDTVYKNGFRATKCDVLVIDEVHERHLIDIQNIILTSSLSEKIKQQSLGVFQRLGEVEAEIHGVPIDAVHLHEVGGLDTIIDVTGCLLGLESLGIDRIIVSPLPMGRGSIRGAHGIIPLPAPATLELLKGVPVVGVDYAFEFVTPTGAALLVSLAESFGVIPPMKLTKIGYGAGGRDLPTPNILRVLVGESPSTEATTLEHLVMTETNLDDLNPQIYGHVMERLFERGALDVTFTPIQMKKNRPGILVSVLSHPTDAAAMEKVIFSETSTIGIRRHTIERHALARKFAKVVTPYGQVSVKIVQIEDGKFRATPEYEDCRQLAVSSGIPLWDIYRSALAAADTYLEKKNMDDPIETIET